MQETRENTRNSVRHIAFVNVLVIGLLCVVFAAGGCQRTHQVRKAEGSGFLGNYYQLRKGTGKQALFVYVSPEARFSKYDKVLLDSVTIWYTDKSDLADVPRKDLQRLADELHWELVTALAKDYQLVGKPGPGVMRIRVAITKAKASKVVLDAVSVVLPPMRLIAGGAMRLATGTSAFVGKAGIEVELIDSMTNRRLAAAVDERAGGKVLRGVTDKWDDVKQAYKHWAGRVRTKLIEFRQQQP